MTRRAGSADLPLHGGHVPRRLADWTKRLGAVTTPVAAESAGNNRSGKAR